MQQTSLRIELALPKQRICALIQHMFHSGENILSCCLVALKAYAKNFYKFEKFIQALYLSSKHDHLFFFAEMASRKLDINKATVDQFEQLAGIGRTKAEAIVNYRRVRLLPVACNIISDF